MYFSNISECLDNIGTYSLGSARGFPLLIDTQNYDDYQKLIHRLSADMVVRCIYVSEHTFSNGLANLQEVIEIIRNEKNCAVFGISESLMLQGADAVDTKLDELIGTPVKGNVIVALNHCRNYLEKYTKRDIRLSNRIIFTDGERTPLVQLLIVKNAGELFGAPYEYGVKSLLSRLERLTDEQVEREETINLVTNFSAALFSKSVYAVVQGTAASGEDAAAMDKPKKPESSSGGAPYFFANPTVRYKIGQTSSIELSSLAPMSQPRLLIDGAFYDGTLSEDKNHAVFALSNQKRVREYSAAVYEGDEDTGVRLTFKLERGTKVKNLFGV